jgi:hypothetical protein
MLFGILDRHPQYGSGRYYDGTFTNLQGGDLSYIHDPNSSDAFGRGRFVKLMRREPLRDDKRLLSTHLLVMGEHLGVPLAQVELLVNSICRTSIDHEYTLFPNGAACGVVKIKSHDHRGTQLDPIQRLMGLATINNGESPNNNLWLPNSYRLLVDPNNPSAPAPLPSILADFESVSTDITMLIQQQTEAMNN